MGDEPVQGARKATRIMGLRWRSRLAASVIVGLGLMVMLAAKPRLLPTNEPPVILMVYEEPVDITPPTLRPPPTPTEDPAKPRPATAMPPALRRPSPAVAIPDRPTPNFPSRLPPDPSSRPPQATSQPGAVPGIARSAPNTSASGISASEAAQAGPSPSPSGQPGLSAATRNRLRVIECQRLDPSERPADCPPQGERLQAEAQEAAGPQYRPERVEGFSRGERTARYSAGLRDPCQTESGARAQHCVPLGPAPSRVRTPQEICRAQGLSNCVDLPPPTPRE